MTQRTRGVRVLLVDDDAMVRRGLRLLLKGFDEIEVVAEVADGDEVLEAVGQHTPAVVLMDLRMRRVDGVRATALVAALPEAPAVVVMTSFDTEREILAALRAGATGYLLKDADPDTIRSAIIGASRAGSSLSASVLDQLVRLAGTSDTNSREREEAHRRLSALTEGELEVARAVARGLTNQEIATTLRLAPTTVKAYVSRAMMKLHVDGNRVQLALAVLEAGPSCRGPRGPYEGAG